MPLFYDLVNETNDVVDNNNKSHPIEEISTSRFDQRTRSLSLAPHVDGEYAGARRQ